MVWKLICNLDFQALTACCAVFAQRTQTSEQSFLTVMLYLLLYLDNVWALRSFSG